MDARLLWAVAALSCVMMGWLLMRLPLSPITQQHVPRHRFNISEGYIIALDGAEQVQERARAYLGIDAVHIFKAINGSEAIRVAFEGLPLYTKLLLEQGARHDHMQLASGAMLGCLLSHVAIWKQVPNGAAVAVLEEVSAIAII